MGDMTRLLLLLLAGVTVSLAVDLYKRILGGQGCNRPYHVKIVDHRDKLICGGSLISNHWILTAAHCWTFVMFAVVPGEGARIRITAPPALFSNDGIHDIMLLELLFPVGAAPVNLPICPRPNRLGPVQIAGYAATITGPHNQRQNFEVPTINCADIRSMTCRHRGISRPATERLFCGHSRYTDVSFGDSGGGVVKNGMIYGVISATFDPGYGFSQPAVFTDVCGYIQWIRHVIRGAAGR